MLSVINLLRSLSADFTTKRKNMNNLAKLVFAASAVFTLSASAQDIQAKSGNSAYLQDSRGVITRSAPGLCWRTGYWTPADAVPGCDGELAKPVVQPTPAPAPPPAPAPVPVPAPVSEKVTFAADTSFAFNQAVLQPDGKAKLDELASKLQGMDLEVIIAVGHTDSVGNDAYNQKLSVRRAEAVKAYLVSRGIEANRIYTEGKGEKQPIADNKTAAGRAQNRRVEVEVVGTRTK
jgi:OOP family OmpA-OmpF porin